VFANSQAFGNWQCIEHKTQHLCIWDHSKGCSPHPTEHSAVECNFAHPTSEDVSVCSRYHSVSLAHYLPSWPLFSPNCSSALIITWNHCITPSKRVTRNTTTLGSVVCERRCGQWHSCFRCCSIRRDAKTLQSSRPQPHKNIHRTESTANCLAWTLPK